MLSASVKFGRPKNVLYASPMNTKIYDPCGLALVTQVLFAQLLQFPGSTCILKAIVPMNFVWKLPVEVVVLKQAAQNDCVIIEAQDRNLQELSRFKGLFVVMCWTYNIDCVLLV